MMAEAGKEWWKSAVVYQIYPRSFYDSNGDGIGDLPGILEKLDYIQSLGIDAVWLNPIYKTPNDDGGYDISDYYTIQPEFGTMEDFDRLLNEMHARGIRLIMDLVVNHSSDEHSWFVQSRQSKTNPYRDFYFWRAGKNNGPPNNYPSFFGGSAWEHDPLTDEYYLHLFSKKQADLNWESPSLRDAIYEMMDFWLKKGVDGLRLDVISCISKHTDFPDTDTTDFNETIRRYYANGPRLKEYLAEMNERVFTKYNCLTVGEGPGITTDNALYYLSKDKGLNMIFHFGHMFMDQGAGGRFDPVPWTLSEFKAIFRKWNALFATEGWGSVFLGNHDFPRMVSRWGNDREYWRESSTLLLTLLLTMPGTPFIFQGDEIGMTNVAFTQMNEVQDVESRNGWAEAKKRGVDETEFLGVINAMGRDNARTPFQWNADRNAGFTTGEPWILVNSNYKSINVERQLTESKSILGYYKSCIQLRKQHTCLVHGAYAEVGGIDERVYAYTRTNSQEKIFVLLNLCSDNIILDKAFLPTRYTLCVSNYQDDTVQNLRPWEARVLTIN